MPLFDSESLVLKSYNLAEADRIVVFFTKEHGVVRGVAKGAKRLKSRFGSTLEPFSIVNLTYFQKEDRELVSIQNVDLVRSSFEDASDPEFLRTFSYAAELLLAFVPPHDPSETVYRMANACLAAAKADPTSLSAIRLYFELWLLRLGGFLPEWETCSRCRQKLEADEPAGLYRDYHLRCAACKDASVLQGIDPSHRKVFHNVQKFSPQEFAGYASDNVRAVSEVSSAMRRIISHVLGRDIEPSREVRLDPDNTGRMGAANS